ncbi:MAG: endolytic transglycosylase MltG [Ferruginibacter sp.]
MKKILTAVLIILLAGGAWAGWNLYGPTITAPEGKYFYIRSGSGYDEVEKELFEKGIVKNKFWFNKVVTQVNYAKNIKPGRYEIKAGSSLVNLVKMLKRGYQTPVNFTISKLRTKEDLAGRISRSFETDSATAIQFLLSNDSLKKYSLDTNTAMTAVIPNTYSIKWTTPFNKIFERLKTEQEKFWTAERSQKAKNKNLSREKVYTIASIVEEETNFADDKGLIASVYINRVNKGMRLEADPTVKYAMRDFGLKRILHEHLDYSSPYNTYRNSGFPPGPICTPSPATIDAVLDAPETNYIFFVAKPDFRGGSNFAETYAQHLLYARAYQKALDSLILSKQQKK